MRERRTGSPVGYGLIVKNVLALMVPLMLTVRHVRHGLVVRHHLQRAGSSDDRCRLARARETAPPATTQNPVAPDKPQDASTSSAQGPGTAEEKPQELGAAETTVESTEPSQPARRAASRDGLARRADRQHRRRGRFPSTSMPGSGGSSRSRALVLAIYYWRMDGDQLEILKELVVSVVPLGVLTVVVLAVILFGITTATESAAIGALGALYLAVMAKFPRQVWWWSLVGAIIGVVLGWPRGGFVTLLVSGSLGATFVGTLVPWFWHVRTSRELRQNLKESVFLTAKTTAMVCWLFVGSALFSGVFALHGGQGLIERWVLGMNLSPVGFLIISQLIIFLLGWPLEWTEIIVIFCPIFIPLLSHFQVDPILFGTMVAVNLQAAFLSPPVAMSAFYLKGVAPSHVTLNQIFAGMMPYMIIVCSVPRVHVHLAGHDAVAAGVSIRQWLTISEVHNVQSRSSIVQRTTTYARCPPPAGLGLLASRTPRC